MAYRSSKVFGPYSCCFRQPTASSHCRFFHGYGLKFKLTFQADILDNNNWVMDFGGLKPIKAYLEETFDHRMIVARGDPVAGLCDSLGKSGAADVLYLPKVGCEAFATLVASFVQHWLESEGHAPPVRLIEVECREHELNAGYWVA